MDMQLAKQNFNLIQSLYHAGKKPTEILAEIKRKGLKTARGNKPNINYVYSIIYKKKTAETPKTGTVVDATDSGAVEPVFVARTDKTTQGLSAEIRLNIIEIIATADLEPMDAMAFVRKTLLM